MMTDYKKAALLLHEVSSEDCRWLLSKLPREAAAEIEKYIGELNSLGIPRDKNIVTNALKQAEEITIERDLINKVNRFSVDEVYCALNDESFCFVETVVSAFDWAWAAAVKKMLTKSNNLKFRKDSADIKPLKEKDSKIRVIVLESLIEKITGVQPGVVVIDGVGGKT